MTKSTITREESVQAIFDLKVGYRLEFADIENLKRVARMALAAMDGEPVILYRQVNPVNGMKTYWAELDPEEFRHLKQHTDENAEFMTLYRHAQPAPVVPGELKEAAADLLATLDDYPEQLVPINRKSSVVRALRAAMLPAAPACTCPSGDGSLRWPCPVHPGNSPVIPDGSASMLRRWLAFGRGMQNAGSQLPRNLIAETEEMLAAAPHDTPALNSLQSVDSVAGKWIPVSERMPKRGDYLVTDGRDFDVQTFDGEQFIPGFVWDDGITHWMPLPAAPQEVKGE
ncbi:DUF551 domain-containing protein [Klebsiella michiganensis]|uniref:DUF551 domain-containing protein n=1 Tax=Klebsiella michiganensis TaxID=1134687 RepID=UPI0018C4F466|nr:DUF551 domain-containing protein [Klebsiella michiganensis]MBG2622119.1 DUF551 domain-containing protein [Klebsiella michiganensis]MBG2633846.1 DUF551 domain-containing protein [Klebsiella michiganensis]